MHTNTLNFYLVKDRGNIFAKFMVDKNLIFFLLSYSSFFPSTNIIKFWLVLCRNWKCKGREHRFSPCSCCYPKVTVYGKNCRKIFWLLQIGEWSQLHELSSVDARGQDTCTTLFGNSPVLLPNHQKRQVNITYKQARQKRLGGT